MIRPFFRWYDLWVGIYIDVENEAVYICPIPMFGIRVQLPLAVNCKRWQVTLTTRVAFAKGAWPNYPEDYRRRRQRLLDWWQIGPLQIRHLVSSESIK